MDKFKLKEKRTKELLRVGKIVIGYIAIPVILQAIYTDIKVHGYDQLWIALRLGIIPIGLLSLMSYKLNYFRKKPTLPILTVALYVTAIHLFFVSQTGYAESKYFHSYIQLLMGFTILPFARRTYIFGTGIIIGSYSLLILRHANFDWTVFSQSNVIFLKTYVAMAYATYFVMNSVRNKFYAKEIELESELETRASIIEEKAKELSAAKIELIRRDAENMRYKALGDLAAQVAHNVRSPVGTIDVIVNSTPELPAAAKIPLLNAIAQIRGVANKLLKSKPHELESRTSDVSLVSLRDLLANVIEEKTLLLSRHQNVQIRSNIKDLVSSDFVSRVDSTEFKAAVANLIHNSFESMDHQITINISLRADGDKIIIAVEDNGRGMPESVLLNVRQGNLGFSYLKPDGSGLGIPHAKSSVESWGGTFSIHSVENFGTKVELTFSKSNFRLNLPRRAVRQHSEPVPMLEVN